MNSMVKKDNRGVGTAMALVSILTLVWIIGSIVLMLYS